MLTFSPVPEWKKIFSAFMNLYSGPRSDWMNATHYLGRSMQNKKENKQYYTLSKSSWSLYLIIEWYKKYHKVENPVLWVPDYFCNQTLLQLNLTSCKLVFYPVTEKLIPNWNICESLAKDNPPHLFLLVHYFGKKSDIINAREFCRKNNSYFIEDGAHLLRPFSDIGKYSDFIFFSPHKILPIANGSFLYFSHSSYKAIQIMDEIYHELPADYPNISTWLFKRLVQKVIKGKLTKLANNFDDDPVVYPQFYNPKMDRFSRKYLDLYTEDEISQIGFKKRSFYSLWNSIFEILEIKSLNFPNSLCSEDEVPYMASFKLSSHQDCKKVYQALLEKGILASHWPDLNKHVKENIEIYPEANKYRQTILFLPIHPTLCMQTIRKIIKKNFPKKEEGFKLKWESIGSEKWEEYLSKAKKSNILQKWEYGEVKKQHQGWNTKRGVIYKNDHAIGVIQSLDKPILKIGKIVRINRAPLWIDHNLTLKDKLHTLFMLRRQFSYQKRTVLIYAPEFEDNVANNFLLRVSQFYSIKIPGFSSSWVNLSLSLDELRKSLKSKWRNQLNLSEKSDLFFEVSKSRDDFSDLMNNYQGLMTSKSFIGPSREIIISLKEKLKETEDFVLMKASKESEYLGSIIVVKHGKACTYLVGYNNDKGRKLNANNFLLWNAIKEMKDRGCLWLDLGGLDEKITPQVTHFKRGIGGEEYTLMRNYI